MKKKPLLGKKERLGNDSKYDFDGPIEGVIERLQNAKAEYEKKGYTNITVEFEDVWGYYDDHYLEIVYYGHKAVSVKEFVEGKEQCIRTST
jgi:hypothetical protein